MIAERMQQVRDRVARLITDYQRAYPTRPLPPIEIYFDLKGRAAGQAGRYHGRYYMRFNQDMIQTHAWDHVFKDTVPHELAHVICMYLGTDQGHGQTWRRTCQWLGGSGSTCHAEKVVYARGNTYAYTTTRGVQVHVSSIRHQRVQQGLVYQYKNQGTIDKNSRYYIV